MKRSLNLLGLYVALQRSAVAIAYLLSHLALSSLRVSVHQGARAAAQHQLDELSVLCRCQV